MARKPFMPGDDLGKSSWLNNFAAKLSKYAPKYGLSDDEVADMGAAAIYFSYWLGYISQSTSFSQNLTTYKNEVRDGSGANVISIAPAPPQMVAAPPVVAPGVFARASSLANRIKSHIGYTEADGMDLGLIGADDTTDKNNVKPAFSIRLVAGGHPEIVWTKAGMTGIEIWADRTNSGTFQMIDIDNSPNYTDMAALPAAPASWKYKLIYRNGTNQIGQWSDVVAITVNIG